MGEDQLAKNGDETIPVKEQPAPSIKQLPTPNISPINHNSQKPLIKVLLTKDSTAPRHMFATIPGEDSPDSIENLTMSTFTTISVQNEGGDMEFHLSQKFMQTLLKILCGNTDSFEKCLDTFGPSEKGRLLELAEDNFSVKGDLGSTQMYCNPQLKSDETHTIPISEGAVGKNENGNEMERITRGKSSTLENNTVCSSTTPDQPVVVSNCSTNISMSKKRRNAYKTEAKDCKLKRNNGRPTIINPTVSKDEQVYIQAIETHLKAKLKSPPPKPLTITFDAVSGFMLELMKGRTKSLFLSADELIGFIECIMDFVIENKADKKKSKWERLLSSTLTTSSYAWKGLLAKNAVFKDKDRINAIACAAANALKIRFKFYDSGDKPLPKPVKNTNVHHSRLCFVLTSLLYGLHISSGSKTIVFDDNFMNFANIWLTYAEKASLEGFETGKLFLKVPEDRQAAFIKAKTEPDKHWISSRKWIYDNWHYLFSLKEDRMAMDGTPLVRDELCARLGKNKLSDNEVYNNVELFDGEAKFIEECKSKRYYEKYSGSNSDDGDSD